MLKLLKRLGRETFGTTAIEYGLISALVALATVATLTTVGTSLSAVFGSVAGSL